MMSIHLRKGPRTTIQRTKMTNIIVLFGMLCTNIHLKDTKKADDKSSTQAELYYKEEQDMDE